MPIPLSVALRGAPLSFHEMLTQAGPILVIFPLVITIVFAGVLWTARKDKKEMLRIGITQVAMLVLFAAILGGLGFLGVIQDRHDMGELATVVGSGHSTVAIYCGTLSPCTLQNAYGIKVSDSQGNVKSVIVGMAIAIRADSIIKENTRGKLSLSGPGWSGGSYSPASL